MKFRLWSLLWVMAMFASALATFGVLGIVAAAAILFSLLLSSDLPNKVARVIATLGVATLVSILLGAIVQASQMQHGLHCLNNLKVLALSILTYESSKHELPIAQTIIGNKPGHSWRTAIIPYLESTQWWGSIDFTKPWESAANMAIYQGLNIELFQCPNHALLGTPLTSYFAVVDPRTVWSPDGACKLGDIKDGTLNTILLLEAPNSNVRWYEPGDLSFQEAINLLTSVPTDENPVGHKVYNGFLRKPSFSLGVVFVDAHTQLVSLPLDRELAVALLTKAGGEEIDPAELQSELEPELDYAKIFALCAFILTAVLPALRTRGQAVTQAPGDQVISRLLG